MRDLVKKVGSLVLGIGALSLLLANAALTHGCSGARRDAPATQVGEPPPAATEEQPRAAEPSPPAGAAPAASSEDEDCDEAPHYMHATKAPVMPMRRCGKSTPSAKRTAEPASPKNNAQQAP
jgi:hypothetical protein